jgi:cytochrome c553
MKSYLAFSAAILAACGVDTGGPTGPGPGSGVTGGLPCDVQAVLEQSCTSCHGRPLAGGAPMALETYADLMRTKNGTTYAALSLQRMQSTTTPMPPAPAAPLAAADIATFQAWLDAGTPQGDCGGSTTNPFDLPPQCTSNVFYTGGESSQMEPGGACIACHASELEAPKYSAAGTVYATGHEPDRCDGAPTGTIEITDANGVVQALTVNSAGNFYTQSALAFPITAKVVTASGTRAMAGAVTTADCNGCHTQSGANGAPGRIALP